MFESLENGNRFIGDHVWIGQSAMILKGTKAESGSIIGAMSVVSNKKINANSSWAGNPAKKVKEGIFRNRPCVHTWTEYKTKESMFYDKDNFIFTYRGDEYILFDETEEKLDAKASVDSKIEYLGKISADKHKNRFCSQKVKQKRWFKRTVRKIKRKAACLKTAVFHRS